MDPRLEPERRQRMRRKVLAQLDPRPATPLDHAYTGLTLLARPAPIFVRGLSVLLALAMLVAGTGAASADSLPDEPLYAMKLVTEQLRLTLATTPEDRATVELSLAEHRLAEAERLAEQGREGAALEASSAYGTHLANAAAELATSASAFMQTDALVAQLETRLTKQREKVAATAVKLAQDPRTATAAAVLATVTATATPVDGSTAAARIASNAAQFSDRAAKAAEAQVLAAAKPPAVVPQPTSSSRPTIAPTTAPAGAPTARSAIGAATPTRPAATATGPATVTPRATETPVRPLVAATPRATATQSIESAAAARAAGRARVAADAAKKAAEKAAQAVRKTTQPARTPQTPAPVPTRR